MHTEIPEELSSYDRFAAAFTKPYTFVSFADLCGTTNAGKNKISDYLFTLRRHTGKDIESVYRAGGCCWVPEDSGTHFDLANFRNPSAEMAKIPVRQREAVEQIWRYIRKVERIEYQWRGQTIHVLKPLIPVWVHETLCTMITVLAEEERGLEWPDVYSIDIGKKRGSDNLSRTATALNNYCKAQSLPYRLTSEYGTSQYRFVVR